MLNRSSRPIRSLLAAALITAGGFALLSAPAAHARAAEPVSALTPSESVRVAGDLALGGKPVRARAELLRALGKNGGASLTDSERARAYDLLASVNQQIKSLDRNELSIQKADLALVEGELLAAQRQAEAVARSSNKTAAQSAEADRILAAVKARQAEVAPRVAAALDQAVADFNEGYYLEAKAGLAAVERSGVRLAPAQRDQLALYQGRIIEVETNRGSIYDISTIAASVLDDPGVVRRRTPPDEPAAGNGQMAQPEKEPENQPPPVQPIAAEPPPAEPPPAYVPPPPPQEDLIQLARRIAAQDMLSEADQAFDDSRLNEAETKYTRLRDTARDYLTPDQVRHVENRIVETQLRIRAVRQEGGLLQDHIQSTATAKQQALAEFQNTIEMADRALADGDFGRANDLTARARVQLNSARNLFREAELQAFNRQIDEKLRSIASAQEAARAREDARRAVEEQDRTARAQRDAIAKKERDIKELLDRARTLQVEMRYREALQVVDQILFLDPINPAGLILKDILSDALVYVTWNRQQGEFHRAIGMTELDNQGALNPPRGIMDYPPDWPQISYRRGEPGQFADTPENRRVLGQLDGKRIPSIKFQDNTLEQTVAFLQSVTGVNLDVDWASLEHAGVSRETRVNLALSNMPARVILDRVMEKVSSESGARAGWAINNGILTIASQEQLNKHRTTEVYDIKDLMVEIPNYTNAPEFDLATVLGRAKSINGSSPFQGGGRAVEAKRTLEERTQELIGLITANVDHDGWVDNGGDVGFVQTFQGNLVVTNTPRNHRAIEGLLSKLRAQRSLQINVETRFLLVSNDWFEQIGFDLDVYLNASNSQVRFAQGNNAAVVPSDFFPLGAYNRNLSVPQVGPLTGATLQNINQNVPAARGWSPIGFNQGSLALGEQILPQVGLYGDIAGKTPALGIAGQFLDDIQVDFLVKATQADRRNVTLTAPRLTFANGQIANISVGTQVAFVSDLTPVVSESSAAFDPQLEVVTEGVVLRAEGYISADRRYVTLNVTTAVSKIEGFENTPVSAIAGGTIVTSAATQSFLQRPTVTVTQVNTSVTVPDQGTVLMGGQRLINETEVETGVPILSKIPIINRFFSNRLSNKSEQTLLILIKPTILIQNEEEEKNFPGLNDALRAGGIGG